MIRARGLLSGCLLFIAAIGEAPACARASPALPWPDAAPAPELPAKFAEAVMPPVVVALPGMDQVRYVRDLDYAGAPDPVRMDLYLPREPLPGGAPIVLFVHGGTDTRARPKDWGLYQSWGRLAAASGMAGVTITHRLSFPQTRVREGAADVAAALAFLRANAASYGLDAGRICIAAFSAGGPLLSPYMVDAPPGIRCLIGWYPFMDIRQSEHHRQSETAETRDAFSNILRLEEPGTKTPLYLVRAGRDEIPTLLHSVDRFAAAALRANYPLTVANHPDAPHGFDNKTNDARAREIILAVLAFLKRSLSADPAAAE